MACKRVEDELAAKKDALRRLPNVTLWQPNMSAIVKGGLKRLENSMVLSST